MNLRRVAIFVTVVDAGGMNAAARTLGLQKSAVSAAMAQLETELGVRLLRRGSRNVTLTEAGEAFYGRAAPALRALEDASVAAADEQLELKGGIRMTAAVEVGTRLLEPLLARFLKANPAVTVDLVLTTRALDLADEGIDLAVRGGPVNDETLVAKRLAVEDAGLFAAPAYLRERGKPKQLADLSSHSCVVYRPTRAKGLWSLSGPNGIEKVEVTARVGADQFAFILRSAVSGVGVALLPLFMCTAEVASGELVRVLPKYAMRGTLLQLVYPSGRFLPRRVAALRDFLVAELRRG